MTDHKTATHEEWLAVAVSVGIKCPGRRSRDLTLLFPGAPILHENGFAQVTWNDPDLGRELPPEVANVLESDRPADFPDRSFRTDETPLGKVDSSGQHVLMRCEPGRILEATREVKRAQPDERGKMIKRYDALEVRFDEIEHDADRVVAEPCGGRLGPARIDAMLKQQHAADQKMRQMIGLDVRERDLAHAGAPQNVTDTQHHRIVRQRDPALPAQRRFELEMANVLAFRRRP